RKSAARNGYGCRSYTPSTTSPTNEVPSSFANCAVITPRRETKLSAHGCTRSLNRNPSPTVPGWAKKKSSYWTASVGSTSQHGFEVSCWQIGNGIGTTEVSLTCP